MVLNKKSKEKDELRFDMNLFYLKSFKKKTFSFSYVKEPFFRGTIVFGLDFKNKIRPLNFQKIEKEGTMSPLDPLLFKKILLSEKNKFISFSDLTDSEDIFPIKEMFKNFQLKEEKIVKLSFCKSCLLKRKFTILSSNQQIKSYQEQIICSECAYKIVLRNIKLTGLVSQERISPKLKNFFTHMILKFKNVEKVINSFKVDFNPIKNTEITLYDIEQTPTISKKYFNQKFNDIDIPQKFKKVLRESNISILLPIQAISIERGLLSENANQLIMAPTSSGKTLIGELAGITKVLNDTHSRMLYLVPIVALANIRTEEFKEKYKSINLKIVKKVGESLFEKKEEFVQENLTDADVIIATYEAIDYILRSGSKEVIGNIKTIIVDEIQTLIDPERGFLLDGFIARLKFLYEDAQFLYLSATLGEPNLLAEKLDCELIIYNNRPVPIERHLLLCLSEAHKQKYISQLVKNAYLQKSVYGFKGQSIIFTNTRKNCESITSNLQSKGINVSAYHSGLTNEERKIIEGEFQEQKIIGVVATAALAAGVDLPARQVIFESLAMGINWLTVAEFEQMLGRAGRLKKHEKGIVYLLVQPEKVYSPKMKDSEENVAIKLLNGKIKDFELIPDQDKSISELLAFISMINDWVTKNAIFTFYSYLINNNYDLDESIKKLLSLKLIRVKEDLSFKATRLGRSIAKSFLSIEICFEIIDNMKNNLKNPINIALDLKPLRNVYISKSIVADLSKNVNMKYFSNNLFSASVLSLMNAEYIKKRKTFSQEFIDFIIKWTNEIFNCSCKDNPYCDCGRINIEKLILNLRVKEKMSIEDISNYLKDKYKILIFKGDIVDYLENLIYSLESIKNIVEGISSLASNYSKELIEIPHLIKSIKY